MITPTTSVTRLVPLSAIDESLRRAWSDLAAAAVEPNPYFEPEVLLPAAQHLAGGAALALLTVQRDGELLWAMPVMRERHRRMPLQADSTWRHPYRYLGTPLAREQGLPEAADAALKALGGGWLVLEDLPLDGPVATALRAAALGRGAVWREYDIWERPYVHRRAEATYLEETLSARSAKTLRRQRRNLERDLGGTVVTAQAPVDAEQVTAFLDCEAAGWKGQAGTALASDPRHATFFREVCARLDAVGRVQLWHLCAGPTVVARQCHLRSGDIVFHFKTAYDEGWHRASPGVLLELDVLSAFHADLALAHLDPCTAPTPSPSPSARLYPDQRRMGTALIGLTAAGRLAAKATPAAARAWRAVRR